MAGPVLREGATTDAGLHPYPLNRIRDRVATWVKDGLANFLVLVVVGMGNVMFWVDPRNDLVGAMFGV